MFTIKIKTLSGSTQSVSIQSMDTGLSLKTYLEEKTGIDMKQMKLIYKGKQIVDDSTLISQKVEADNVIHMILAMRGG